MLLSLSSHPEFENILEKYIPTKDLQTVRDTIFTLKTKVLFLSVYVYRKIGILEVKYRHLTLRLLGGVRVLVRCLKILSQPEADVPSRAAVQSEPHRSTESHSTRPTGGCRYQPMHQSSPLRKIYFSQMCNTYGKHVNCDAFYIQGVSQPLQL